MAAQLLEFHYNECHNMLEAVGRVLRRIEGSYAFGIICADYPNALIAARKDSPLIIGCGENENFIASDVTAVIKPYPRCDLHGGRRDRRADGGGRQPFQ